MAIETSRWRLRDAGDLPCSWPAISRDRLWRRKNGHPEWRRLCGLCVARARRREMMSAPWIPRPASNLPVRVASLAPETAEGKNARLTGAREGCPTRVGSWKISSPLFATHREHERCTSAFCRICDKVLSDPSNLQVWSEGSWRASLRPFNARGDHAVRMPIYCRICDKVLSEPIKL